MDFLVQCADGQNAGIVALRIEHSPVPQHIIECDQAAWTDQLERKLVVGAVLRFFSIDECKVERSGSAFRDQRFQSFERGPQAQLNFAFYARFPPIAPRDGRELLAHVAGD